LGCAGSDAPTGLARIAEPQTGASLVFQSIAVANLGSVDSNIILYSDFAADNCQHIDHFYGWFAVKAGTTTVVPFTPGISVPSDTQLCSQVSGNLLEVSLYGYNVKSTLAGVPN
jgi:hypothetical protein